MTERIDHAAEAGFALHRSERDDTLDQAGHLAFAQVHATLALVEQQRIANLIALSSVAKLDDVQVSPLEQQAWEALGIPGVGTLRPDIAAALDITP